MCLHLVYWCWLCYEYPVFMLPVVASMAVLTVIMHFIEEEI